MDETISSSDMAEQSFEDAKTRYFSNVAIQNRDAMRLHKLLGLWERTEAGGRDWGNVTNHCLVEAARVRTIGELIGLDSELQNDLTTAAAMHDVYKKKEKEIMLSMGPSWESYSLAQVKFHEELEARGVKPRVIWLAGSVGHETIPDVEAILAKDVISQDDLAYLIMHYVDDYTVNDTWANSSYDEGGVIKNDIDRRMDANEKNPRYQQVNEDGRMHFNGETTYSAQRRSGHAVELYLAQVISEKTGDEISPLGLPALVDARIREQIENHN